MKALTRCLFWFGSVALTAGLFYLFGATGAQALTDEQTPVTLLTEDGPVQTTMAAYLPFAVAAEMPADFGPEALKAQAVAARTYVLASRSHNNADVCVQSSCCIAYLDEPSLRERWGADYYKNLAAVTEAVTATDGEYLTYGGQAIQAAFHSSSAGFTEDSAAVWSALPYLVSVESPEKAEDVPGLITTVTVPPEDFAAALSLAPSYDPEGWVESTQLDGAGRVRTMTVCGTGFSGAEIRRAFSLRSTAFTVLWDGGAFVFTVSGYGHGVGMSQYGARAYAAQGWTYREILSHYYPGTALTAYVP